MNLLQEITLPRREQPTPDPSSASASGFGATAPKRSGGGQEGNWPLSDTQRLLLEKRLQAARMIAARRGERPAIPRRTKQAPAPLSYAQQRLWFLDQLK